MLAAPDDDEPRLVYADVLQERGDERGEFIPLQCALAKWSARADPQRFAQLREREGELLSEHGPDWVSQSAPFRCVGLFHRGFVEELQCLAGDLLGRGLEVVAPVRVLRLDGDTAAEVAQRVLALPIGGKVRELTLRLVDSAIDPALRAAGASLTAVRQLSADASTIELLSQMGWLDRLERLEFPLAADSGALLEDLAIFKPARLEQLWLHRQTGALDRTVLLALELLWRELPKLTVRWRGIDYHCAHADALGLALVPARVQLGHLVVGGAAATLEPIGDALVAPEGPLVLTDPPQSETPVVELGLVALPAGWQPPPTHPWDAWLRSEGLPSYGFLPRALPRRVTLLRTVERGIARLALNGPGSTGGGAMPFAQDVARLMSLPREPGLLRIERTGVTGSSRWAMFESFEGVSLFELLALHRRLPPGVAARVVGQAARAASLIDRWSPTTDDVLIDVRGQVRLVPGFPATFSDEEPSYTGREDRHPMGTSLEDEQAPATRVMQLGTALFELLTGTTLFEQAGRPMLVIAADWYRLIRQLDRELLSVASVDPSLAPFDPVLHRALSHFEGERFAGLLELAAALELHPLAASAEQVAQMVQEALPRVPRTRDGR